MSDDTQSTPTPEIHVDDSNAEIGDTAASSAEAFGDTARRWTEEMEVAGGELVDKVKELIAEGNVRRIVIRRQDGNKMMEIPLTAGAIAGGLVLYVAPILAALGALAALVSHLRVEIERDGESSDPENRPSLLVFDDEVVKEELAPEVDPEA